MAAMTPRILLALLLVPPGAEAQTIRHDDVAIPAAARPFVAAETRPIAFATGDLDRDGRPDALLVLEATTRKPDDEESDGFTRTLVVLVGQADGTYREAARNAKVAYCTGCGGVMGDPFEGVEVKPGSFTVSNAGGSNWRWSHAYTFNYSRRDRTWQLVRVVSRSLNTGQPDLEEVKVSTPPKDFGKIDLADFDPESWEGEGPR
jgi:hypothetical protein